MIDLSAVVGNYVSSLALADREARFGKKFDPAKVTVAEAQEALTNLYDSNDLFPPVGGEGKKEIMLLLPQYKHTNPVTLFSLLGLWDPTRMRCAMRFGDALIAHSRNKLAQDFLASDCEWALFIDDDMVLPIGNAGWFNGVTGLNLPKDFAGQHTIKRLLAAGKKLVGGLYFGRQPHGKPMFYEGVNKPDVAERLRKTRPTAVQATEWVGTGCLLVHREVFLAIQRTHPWLQPKRADMPWEFFSPAPDAMIRAASGEKVDPAVLQAELAKYRPGTGEDVAFCRRAYAAGHQPHVDFGLVCGHVGGAVYGPTNTTAG